VGNAFKVPPSKKGKFQLHLLVMGDEQRLWMANVALKTESRSLLRGRKRGQDRFISDLKGVTVRETPVTW
jgi:hypothetical protein